MLRLPFGNRMKARIKQREELIIPTYSLAKKRRKIPIAVPIIAAVAIVFFFAIYFPPMVMDEPDMTTRASVDLRGTADPMAMERASSFLRNNPDADFDKDGLTNEVEVAHNTGVYLPDNDNDGVTDYAELYITESNPTVYDTGIENHVKQLDVSNKSTVNTPFKLHDVVMWADDYQSKARGGVIPLADGSYTFYMFQGWVQFPNDPAAAYKVVNGTQSALKVNDNGYFYIDTKDAVNVRVYQEKPEQCYIVSLLGNRYSLPDNFFTKVLSFLLPSKGFGLITCKPALVNDIDGTWQETATTNDIVTFKPGAYSDDRFGRNELDVTTLANIYNQIDKGNNIVISLMSHEVGEVILEVYGYTNRNNLLVCDPQSGTPLGVINITVLAERVMNQEGKIVPYEHYVFSGCGYTSAARHRLTVIDVIRSEGQIPEVNRDSE